MKPFSNPLRAFLSPDILRQLQEVYGSQVEQVLSAMARPAERYYLRVNTLKETPEGVVKRLRGKGIQAFQHPSVAEAIWLPAEGPFPVDPRLLKVVVDKFTAESVLTGASVYAPGIVSCRGLKKGEEVSIVDVNGNLVGGGVAAMGETEVLTLRRGLAVKLTHPVYTVPSLRETEEFKEGLIYPQSLPAMVTVRVLDPKPGETVVDFNCAPGGKLSHIYQLMEGLGEILGVDRNARKISATKENLNRLGCRGVKLMVKDSRFLDLELPELKADRCLVDPPCSALGVTPKLYDGKTEEDLQALAEYQKQFLKAASKMLKPGGVLVYSVCTVTLLECEKVARYAMDHCGLRPEPQPCHLGCRGQVSLFPEAAFMQRFHPHLHGSGYFIARFRKLGEPCPEF
ncbi:RsmB/NOP family class I SAM-dependent RNA methyltransferase [Candidatus Hecatella orcuttiae]|uniref:RsmB/NOP family class I SAM-dependent RNA methyltransferase n=1 Tax=Candidatus Hecatella orcuttiae TaxID=1935119 RepID=UPI0028682942|nr:RsmB/NOP family class I SAM-dependent RNA methyltransferase [Candidatus Hecatella orcuttiae]